MLLAATSHLALFYETQQTLWAHSCTLIANHVVTGNQWRYIADEHSTATITSALAAQQAEMNRGTVLDSAQFHFRTSPIRIPAIIDALKTLIEQVLADGAPGLLLLIEMTWTIRTPSGDVYLREYEAALHALLERYPITIVCLYNAAVLPDHQLLTALHVHPQIDTAHGLQRNPYFVPPLLYAQRDLRAQFTYWLRQIEEAGTHNAEYTEVGRIIEQPPELHLRSLYHLEAPTPLVAADGEQKRWKIRCLGRLHIYRENGEQVQWNVVSGATRKTKTLFAYLLYRGTQGATLEELADLLWPEASDLKQSLNRLYHTVRCLRAALSPDRPAGRESPFLPYRDQRYFLAVPPDTWIDLPIFQEMCYRGGTHLQLGRRAEALLCFQSAERLYSGDLFADIPDKYAANHEQDWCWSQRFWFRNMMIKALWGTASIYRQQEQIAEALAYCDKALRLDPASEMAHQEKMRVLAAAKRFDALDRQYRLYCQSLEQFQLGEPAQETKQLYQLLAQ